jgi:tripartite-type tricarboxylate transporter receptor subunit TctC
MLKKLITAGLMLLASHAALADTYPSQTITMVIPFSAGGPTDTIARILAQTMAKSLKQNIIVENATGAGGTLGAGKVARATPDGYTLLLHHNGMATSPALYRKLAFNPLTDFEYIGQVADVPMVLLARKDLAPNTLPELLEYIKANKSTLTMGNAGLGAVSHQCGMLFLSAIGTPITTVPYKGTGPAMNDLLGGQIDLLCDQTTNTTSQIEAKKVKPYAVTTLKRLTTPVLKDIPTLDESGMKNFQVTIWHGLYAPKGTPPAVVKTLNDALKVALKDPEFIKKEEGLGAVVVTDKRMEPAEHKKFVQAEVARFGPVVKAAGAYAD